MAGIMLEEPSAVPLGEPNGGILMELWKILSNAEAVNNI